MRSAQHGSPVSVLDRIFAILDAVREAQEPATIAQLVSATGIPKSTAARLVAELTRQRYLARTDEGIVIGLRLFELGARASTPRRLGAAALPVLAELFHETGEHLNVAVHEGADMLTVLSVCGRLRPAPSRAGVRVPVVTTALGKAVLAFADDDIVRARAFIGLDAQLRHRIEKELDAVRRREFAVDAGDTFPGVVAVASPVLSAAQLPVAAISVAGPAADMDPKRVAPLVHHAAHTLTRRLATAMT